MHNVQSATQSDIADKLSIDFRSYANYKKLTTLIPELQDMVDSGSLTTSVASRIIARLSPADQKLELLLVANFGRSKNDPIKQGKVYQEYEKLCGVRQGSNNPKGTIIGEADNRPHVTLEQIANELGVDVRMLQRIKSLQTL